MFINMNIRDYQYILAVAETGHFGKAAEQCNVSQPTLSMQIKKFEERNQIKIFERTTKSVTLTHEGERLMPLIHRVFKAHNTVIETAKFIADPDTITLKIGGFPTLAPFLFPHVMPEIVNAMPAAKMFLVEERSATLLEMLENHDLDAAFLALPLEDQYSQMITVPVLNEPFYVAVPTKHPLASRSELDLPELKEETLLLLEDSHCLSGQALAVCNWVQPAQSNGVDFRATSIETLRQMVANGLGITLMPEMARGLNDDGITYVPISPEARAGRKIGLVWRSSFPYADTLHKIATIVQDNFKK